MFCLNIGKAQIIHTDVRGQNPYTEKPKFSPFLCYPAAASLKDNFLIWFHGTKKTQTPFCHPPRITGEVNQSKNKPQQTSLSMLMKTLLTTQLPHHTAGCSCSQLKAVKWDGEHLVPPPQLKPIQHYPKGALQGIGCCPVSILDALCMFRLRYFPPFLTKPSSSGS